MQGGTSGKEFAYQCRRHQRCGFDPWVEKIPWRRKWLPTPVSLPGESHGQRSLAGYSQSIGSQRVRNDWSDLACTHKNFSNTFCRYRQVYSKIYVEGYQFISVAQLGPTLWDPWTWALQTSLSITNSKSLLKFMSIESVMPSNHLILCRPLLLPPSTFPSIRIFSNESALHIRWPKYWHFSLSISPSNEYSGLISFMMDWLDSLLFKGLSKVFSNTTVQKHQFFGAQLSL